MTLLLRSLKLAVSLLLQLTPIYFNAMTFVSENSIFWTEEYWIQTISSRIKKTSVRYVCLATEPSNSFFIFFSVILKFFIYAYYLWSSKFKLLSNHKNISNWMKKELLWCLILSHIMKYYFCQNAFKNILSIIGLAWSKGD